MPLRKSEPGDQLPSPNASNGTMADIFRFWDGANCLYANIISENPQPKVALLSNGAEPQKGAPEVVEAHQLLRKQDSILFAGNVEGIDIPKGSVDVIVCEGFLGNVVLKMMYWDMSVSETMFLISNNQWSFFTGNY